MQASCSRDGKGRSPRSVRGAAVVAGIISGAAALLGICPGLTLAQSRSIDTRDASPTRPTLRVASFTSLIPIQRQAFADAWAASSGVAVEFEAVDRVMDGLRAQVASGAPRWQVVDMNLPDALAACRDALIEPLDRSALSGGSKHSAAEGDFLPGVVSRCAVGNLAWSSVIAHRADVHAPGDSAPVATRGSASAAEPTGASGSRPGAGPSPLTIAALFDTTRFPGKRALNPYPFMNLERALVADGVAPSQVYAVLATREGEDRAFARLRALAPHIEWLGPELRPLDALREGRAAFAAVNNGSLFRAQFESGQALQTIWDAQAWTLDVWVIPRGAPERERALAFIAAAVSGPAQAAQARSTSWGPVRTTAVPLVGRHPQLGIEMAPHLVAAAPNISRAIALDPVFWARHQARLGMRFQREFGVYRAPYAESGTGASATVLDCEDCPEMVLLPPGRFLMGSSAAVTDREQHAVERVRDERPRREVTIAHRLAVSRYEVTRRQFAAFARATGFRAKADCWVKFNGGGGGKAPGRTWEAPGGDGPGIAAQTDDHPVICVGWDDAVAYADWLQRTTGKPYRLLTEAEWEYAALGSTTPVSESLRPWGDDLALACRFANAPDLNVERVKPQGVAARCDDGFARTAPVGTFTPNGFGLHDTMGNVWEWVADCWRDRYDATPTDGSRAPDFPACKRGMRGGSWSETSIKFRTAARGKGLVDDRGDSIGIRVGYTIQ
jgi:formylglycine-generating enzyme required for sulfatase activity